MGWDRGGRSGTVLVLVVAVLSSRLRLTDISSNVRRILRLPLASLPVRIDRSGGDNDEVVLWVLSSGDVGAANDVDPMGPRGGMMVAVAASVGAAVF